MKMSYWKKKKEKQIFPKADESPSQNRQANAILIFY